MLWVGVVGWRGSRWKLVVEEAVCGGELVSNGCPLVWRRFSTSRKILLTTKATSIVVFGSLITYR